MPTFPPSVLCPIGHSNTTPPANSSYANNGSVWYFQIICSTDGCPYSTTPGFSIGIGGSYTPQTINYPTQNTQPSNPTLGQAYFDPSLGPQFWNGNTWMSLMPTLSGSSGTPTVISAGNTVTIAAGTQMLWSDGITVGGSIIINGSFKGI